MTEKPRLVHSLQTMLLGVYIHIYILSDIPPIIAFYKQKLLALFLFWFFIFVLGFVVVVDSLL